MPEQERVIITQAVYVASAVKREQYPEEKMPEIVFIGRSNVGKSSLINSLTRVKNLARVSSQFTRWMTGVEIHHQHPVGARHREHVGHQPRADAHLRRRRQQPALAQVVAGDDATADDGRMNRVQHPRQQHQVHPRR